MYKILLIHNKGSGVQDLNILLTNLAFNTYLADDVLNGIEIAKIYVPDLILCDIQENGVDGKSVVRELVQHERTQTIPLLYLASNPSFDEMREIMNEGADDYFPYPLIEEELISAIRARLEKFRALKEKFDTLQRESIESPGDVPQPENHVLVKIGTNLRIIKFPEIVCILALKEYSKVVTRDSKKYVIRKSMRKWMETLPQSSFLQIHRSTIINTNCIEKITCGYDGSHEISLTNCDSPFQVSVRNAKKLKKLRINVSDLPI